MYFKESGLLIVSNAGHNGQVKLRIPTKGMLGEYLKEFKTFIKNIGFVAETYQTWGNDDNKCSWFERMVCPDETELAIILHTKHDAERWEQNIQKINAKFKELVDKNSKERGGTAAEIFMERGLL